VAGLPEGHSTEAFSSIQIPKRPDQIDKIRHLCQIWRNRADLREAYIETAGTVEKEVGLSKIDLSAKVITELDTFPCIENKLLLSAERSILGGKPEVALNLAERRAQSFWSLQDHLQQLRWILIENSSQTLILGKMVRSELKRGKKSPEEMISCYIEGSTPWHAVDTCYRRLERQYSSFDLDLRGEHDELEKVISHVRQDYTRTVEQSVEVFTKAVEQAGLRIEGYTAQTEVFGKFVKPLLGRDKKTAYILVDALRYEMAKELIDGLSEEFEAELLPCVGQLPTLTSVGMAALMPGAEAAIELSDVSGAKPVVRLGSVILRDRSARVKYFEDSVEANVVTCKLNELIKPTKKRQTEIQAASVVLVTSQEIDRWGENPDVEEEARLFMEEMLDRLRRVTRRLAAMGVEQIVVTADHGHLFGETIESGMKMDPPGGHTAELHRRVWIGKGGKSAEGYLRVSAADLGLKGDLEFSFPRSLACFKTKGASMAYFHGGISLQEMIIPIILMRAKKTKPYAPEMAGVTLTMDKSKVTTRFFSITATYYVVGLLGADEIRVIMSVKADRKEVGFAAVAAYGFEESTKEIVLQKDRPNAVTLMLSDVKDISSVSVHVMDAISQVELKRLEHIPVQISI